MTNYTALAERVEGADSMSFGDFYDVWPDGRVWSRTSARWLRPTYNNGYAKLTLRINGVTKTVRVNRVVCEAFHGKPPFPEAEARHLNGNRGDNRRANLAWGSKSENARDSIRHGTCPRANNGRKGAAKLRGEGGSNARLTWAQAEEIRLRRATTGESYAVIAQSFDVERSTIYQIVSNKTWQNSASLMAPSLRARSTS